MFESYLIHFFWNKFFTTLMILFPIWNWLASGEFWWRIMYLVAAFISEILIVTTKKNYKKNIQISQIVDTFHCAKKKLINWSFQPQNTLWCNKLTQHGQNYIDSNWNWSLTLISFVYKFILLRFLYTMTSIKSIRFANEIWVLKLIKIWSEMVQSQKRSLNRLSSQSNVAIRYTELP